MSLTFMKNKYIDLSISFCYLVCLFLQNICLYFAQIFSKLANKADTNNLPYGFRDINVMLWGNDVPQIDDANAGLTVKGAPTSEYAGCDTWYYFTFYEGGNNNKSYGIQLAIPRYMYTSILLRQKSNGVWTNWGWIQN